MTSGWHPVSPPAWTPVGSVKGPEGPSVEVVPYSMQGVLRVVDSVGRFPISGDCRILSVAAMVEDAPTGQPVIIDVLANGVSIYANPVNRPTIAPGTTRAVVGAHVDALLTDGDYLNCDVAQVGSGAPGTFLTVAIRLRRGGDTNP